MMILASGETWEAPRRGLSSWSSMSFGSTHLCCSTPSAENISTFLVEYVGSCEMASINWHFTDVDRHSSVPMTYRVQLPSIDRHRLYVDRHSSQAHARQTFEFNQQQNFEQRPPYYDALEPMFIHHTTKGHILIVRGRRPRFLIS